MINPSSSRLSSTTAKKTIMLVDDSVVVRGLLRQLIEKYNEFEVVASAIDGQAGVEQFKLKRPDIVLMDIEMPRLNGIEALQEILRIDPGAQVVMCSSLTQSGAEMTVKALELGALDCLAKPTTDNIDRGTGFEDQLVMMLRALPRRSGGSTPVSAPDRQAAAPAPVNKASPVSLVPYPSAFLGSSPRVLAIGSSTGGPKALIEVLSRVDKHISVPIFITQHMPKGFTKILAENLARETGFPVHEAESDMLAKPGHVYIAPGGMHMTLERRSSGVFTVLSDTAPVNFCKPAVDVMVDSLIECYTHGIVMVVLTGMGEDGLQSCRRALETSEKNVLIAQDELTSVVWGMPGAVAKAGICNGIFPLSNIAPAVNRLLRGQQP